MEIVGYIIGGLNLVVGIVITVLRKADDDLLNAYDAIHNKFESALVQYGQIVLTGTDEDLFSLSKKIKDLVFISHKDTNKMYFIEWLINKMLLLTILILGFVIVSIIISNLAFIPPKSKSHFIFLIIIPIVLLFIQFGNLYVILKIERYLKRIKRNYQGVL